MMSDTFGRPAARPQVPDFEAEKKKGAHRMGCLFDFKVKVLKREIMEQFIKVSNDLMEKEIAVSMQTNMKLYTVYFSKWFERFYDKVDVVYKYHINRVKRKTLNALNFQRRVGLLKHSKAMQLYH